MLLLPRSTTILVCALSIWAWVPCGARGASQTAEVVLVLQAQSRDTTGFVSALQIGLGDAYQVNVAHAAPERLPERIALATELVEAQRALAAVWIEHGSAEPNSALLYVVGRRAGRALLEVVHAPDTGELDLPRMLSLKLAELLSQLRDGSAHPLHAPQQLRVPSSPPFAAKDEPRASPTHRIWGGLLFGPRFDVGFGTSWSRFGFGAALSPELSFGQLRLTLGLGVDVYPWLLARVRNSEVALSEVAPRVFAGASWQTPGLTISLQAGPTWGFLSLQGRTPLGYERADTVDVPGLMFAISAERPLSRSLSLGARLELHLAQRRMYFEVNDEPVLDRGRLRLALGFDVTFRTSVAPSP